MERERGRVRGKKQQAVIVPVLNFDMIIILINAPESYETRMPSIRTCDPDSITLFTETTGRICLSFMRFFFELRLSRLFFRPSCSLLCHSLISNFFLLIFSSLRFSVTENHSRFSSSRYISLSRSLSLSDFYQSNFWYAFFQRAPMNYFLK